MMFNQKKFGEKMKLIRKSRNLTQSEEACMIGVSEQAVSKWENGECLPDLFNLRLLSQLLRVSVDQMLDIDNEKSEKVIDKINIGSAIFEIVDRPETIFAGRIMYAKNFSDINTFYAAANQVTIDEEKNIYKDIVDGVFPYNDIHLSVNFWLDENTRALGFVRETSNKIQPQGVDTFVNPASLYIRAYTDRNIAHLVAKETCEIWELFAYIRDYFMPTYGYLMADNGAQELEIFDKDDHVTGYAYMPVTKIV